MHGYPVRIVAGKDGFYQFGSIVADKMSGKFRHLVTKIPFTRIWNGTALRPPVGLEAVDTNSVQNCTTPWTAATFFRDTVTVFCKVKERKRRRRKQSEQRRRDTDSEILTFVYP